MPGVVTAGPSGMEGLEGKSQRELHNARIAGERRNAGNTAAGDVAVGLAELRCVGGVEDFPASLDVPAFGEGEFAKQRRIEYIDVRPAKRVAADIADGANCRDGVRVSRT